MNENLDPTNENFSNEDLEIDKALRPLSFDDFNGQKKVLDNLKIFVQAANQRSEALDHTLLHGPPGLGKTTLAHIIANELSVSLKVSSGPVVDKPGDLAGLLTSLENRDVLFIDEIHRLSPVVEEYLYSAMEDYKIDIMIESGPNARSVQINLNQFTLIGATTRSGLLTAPMRARFGINNRLEYYDNDTLSKIIKRSSKILNIKIDNSASVEIASRSRGTPRICNSLLRRVRDFAQIKGDGNIDLKITKYSLEALNVDKYGLDEMDNKILTTLIKKFKGGPVGITTLATAVSETSETIEEVYELSEAIINQDPKNIEEESGDLLLHILFYAKLGEEKKLFSINTIIEKLIFKLKERHPHIYGNLKAKTSEEVEANWEKIKKRKRKSNETLSNISNKLPPLVKAMRIQEKVKTVGFDWEKKEQVLDKIYEELKELKKEVHKKQNNDKIENEIGDLLFSVINFARFIGIDPEESLEKTNIKFIKRFGSMEKRIIKEGKDLSKMSLPEMDKYWEIAKKDERKQQ